MAKTPAMSLCGGGGGGTNGSIREFAKRIANMTMEIINLGLKLRVLNYFECTMSRVSSYIRLWKGWGHAYNEIMRRTISQICEEMRESLFIFEGVNFSSQRPLHKTSILFLTVRRGQ